MNEDGNRVLLVAAPVRVHPRKPYLFESLATCLRALLPYRWLERFAIVPPENSEQPTAKSRRLNQLAALPELVNETNFTGNRTSLTMSALSVFFCRFSFFMGALLRSLRGVVLLV